ncbi:DUF2953 domain-containing protein [Fredinandcohnia sp. QZ13]|uniref:DUF2953 domain-containing protein n=1 Tax=Fredinandcohnia sp. QZ13 TaxID=3073144 RepID=UPI00285325F0|nr:DUF2953 domain-containing protein [Fredinandcohnia sp. QZ13]MDR4889242.1 DUF2953 domain-containing protein [Fredinandcohnia sp. QZ13]
MKWILFILLFLVLLFLLILVTKLTIFIEANHSQDDDHIKIKFSIWFGLIRYTINVPMVAVDNETPSIVFKKEKKGNVPTDEKKKKEKFSVHNLMDNLHDTKVILQRVTDLVPVFKHFLKKISVSRFEWHSHIGVGDAAHTGIITGLGWSIKGTIVGVMSHYLNLKTHPEYSITPSFQVAVSETRLRCMIHFRIGYAMVAGIKAIKRWRGGLPKFKSQTLSKLNDADSDKKSV